jgi:tetratricopeptide (TPR) repeat protein
VYARLDAEGCGPRIESRSAGTGARSALTVVLTAALALGAAAVADATQPPPADPANDVTVLQRQRGEAADATPGIATTPAGLAAAARAFDRGVRAYGERHFDEAQAAFTVATAAAPRAPDAWANLGTAAWIAGDTVQAAIGWQRALRLAPLASDVRDRLELLPAAQDGWTAGVPPLPADAAAAAGLLVWALAGTLVAMRVLRRTGPRLTPIVWSGAAAAVILLAASVRLGDVAEGRDLAVVRDDGAARVEPALAADQSAPVQVSDVAHVVARQNAWSRVRLDGGREGWIESQRLAPLALP